MTTPVIFADMLTERLMDKLGASTLLALMDVPHN